MADNIRKRKIISISKIPSIWISKFFTINYLILIAVAVVAIMINVDMTAVNLAIPSIAKIFHGTLTQMQWVINIYLLSNVIFIVFAGKLADIIGRKSVYLTGIAIFLIASILIVLAPNLELLLVARAFQGIGFAFTLTLGIVIVTSVFPLERRGFVLGLYITAVGLSQAFGPTIGGSIIQYLGWHWIFLFNIPLCILAFSLILKFYQHQVEKHSSSKIVFSDVMLLGIGLIALFYGFNQLGYWKYYSVKFLLTIMIGCLSLFGFYYKQQRTADPLIDFTIFQSRNFLLINIIRGFFAVSWISIIFSFPVFLQNILGLSPVVSGFILLAMTGASCLTAPIIGLWLDRIGFRVPIFWSLFLALIAFVVFVILPAKLLLPTLIFGLLIFGVSAPIMGSASSGYAMQCLSKKHTNVGMSVFYTTTFLGSAIGVAITGTLLNFLTVRRFAQLIQASNIHLQTRQITLVQHVISGSMSIHNYREILSEPQAKLFGNLIRIGFEGGFATIMCLNILISIGCLVLYSFLKKEN